MNRIKKIFSFSSAGDELINEVNNLVIKFRNKFKGSADIKVEIRSNPKIDVSHPKYSMQLATNPKDDSIYLIIELNPKERLNKELIKSYVFKILVMFLVTMKKPSLDNSREKLFNIIQSLYSREFGISNILELNQNELKDLDGFTKASKYNFAINLSKDLSEYNILFRKLSKITI